MYDILTLHNLEQFVCLSGTGAATYMLTSKSRKWRHVGSWIGVLSLPAWYHTAFINAQWGILVLDVWCMMVYIRGIINNRGDV